MSKFSFLFITLVAISAAMKSELMNDLLSEAKIDMDHEEKLANVAAENSLRSDENEALNISDISFLAFSNGDLEIHSKSSGKVWQTDLDKGSTFKIYSNGTFSILDEQKQTLWTSENEENNCENEQQRSKIGKYFKKHFKKNWRKIFFY